MSVLEAATKVAGASTAKKQPRRVHYVINGKSYRQLERCGKGGSAEVYRVMAENGKPFALKKVRLHGADSAAIAGYKGEIELLKQLQDHDRVVHLYDYMVDEEKQCLFIVSDHAPIPYIETIAHNSTASGIGRRGPGKSIKRENGASFRGSFNSNAAIKCITGLCFRPLLVEGNAPVRKVSSRQEHCPF
jgi:serine/threonine protein kinase